jgi:hypothetical protein
VSRYKKGWSAAHQQVFKLYIEGLTPAEIVEKTKFGIDKVRNIIRTDKFQEHHDTVITNSVESARKLLESRLVEAAGMITRIMRQGKPEERLKFDAAKEVLYQCGMKPVEVVENRTRQYTPEEIQSSLTVMKEVQAIEEKLSTQGSGFLIKRDAEPSEPIVAAPVTAYEVAKTEDIPVVC